MDLASLSANRCTELKPKVAQRQTLGTNVGHGVVSVVVDAEFGPSFQSLKQPASLVRAGQPAGFACSVISVGAELPKQVSCTKK